MALEAQQYAAAEGDVIRMKAYTDLANSAKAPITGTHFSKEVSLGAESNYTDTIKKRIATVKIYKDSDSLPCYSLDVPRLSAEVSGKGVPIGTVIAWLGSKAPTTNGVWLELNGQSCSSYPELVSVLGTSTLPDCRKRFLQGSDIPGKFIDAGLPNITGWFYPKVDADNISLTVDLSFSGAFSRFYDSNQQYFYYPNVGTKNRGYYPTVTFDASRSSKIYGNSTTVQPPAVTVRYFIRAA